VKSGIPIWVTERVRMMQKRMKKLAGMAAAADPPGWEGPADADLTFVAWGSTIGAIRDAMVVLNAQGRTTNLLHFPTVYPLDADRVRAEFAKTKRTLLVEANYSGQFGHLLRAETGIHLSDRLLKYDGEPFYPHEVVARALEVIPHGR